MGRGKKSVSRIENKNQIMHTSGKQQPIFANYSEMSAQTVGAYTVSISFPHPNKSNRNIYQCVRAPTDYNAY